MKEFAAPSGARIIRDEDSLVILWENGQESVFPHHWLKENAPENRNPVTGMKLVSCVEGQDHLNPWSVCVEYDETLVISWAGLREVSRFSLDELRRTTLVIDSAELALSAD